MIFNIISWTVWLFFWFLILIVATLVIIASWPYWPVPVIFFSIHFYLKNYAEKERIRREGKAIAVAESFNPAPIHASAHFATDAELEAAGCFGHGIPLGFTASGRAIVCPDKDVHEIVFGSTGSGKSTNKLILMILAD